MRTFRLPALLLVLFMSAASVASAQVSFGIRIGPPPAPRVVRVVPRRPGPDYVWIQGYWYPTGNKYRWHDGYWTRPPYAGARWVEPHHDGRQYFNGYWEGDRGRIEHDHRSDRNRNRDYRNDRRDNRR
jgi:YXWGXW repeat-containing protein